MTSIISALTTKTDDKEEKPSFPEELAGWNGYFEWEDYPERKKIVHQIIATKKFSPNPEFQFVPLPETNPVLDSKRWEEYHSTVGGGIAEIPGISWDTVLKEKPDMIHLLKFPYNGETPFREIIKNEITPNPYFFVRNHGGVPDIDAQKYFFDVDGLVNKPFRFSLGDLKNEDLFPRMSRVVTIQCSGTRRIDQIRTYPGDGDELINAPWGSGAISTARWTGVSLKKVIKACGGLKDDAKHLEFFGADTYFKGSNVMNYVVSVPWKKVKLNEVMLAWEMNGEPLPKIHGYPLRVVVFGYIGARSVKWLRRVRAIKEPSTAPVQRQEYIHYPQQMGKHNELYSHGISVQEMPVSSAIMTPLNNAVITHDGKIHVEGWAYSGGGRYPLRVEVSSDGGFTWYDVPQENLTKNYEHAWRLWKIDLPVHAEGWLELCCRCWDNALNTQVTNHRDGWNWDLHVTSSVNRLKIYSINTSHELTAKRLQELRLKGEEVTPITHPLDYDIEPKDIMKANIVWPREAEE